MLSLNDIEDTLARPMTAQIILVIFVLLLMHELFADLMNYRGTLTPQQVSTSNAEHGLVRDQTAIKKSLNIPLFGDYVPKAVGDLNVKPSGLNLSLVGVLFSTSSGESQVIISAANGPARTFVVGDDLPGGVKIKQITPDGVVLEREGELESLSLPKNELIFDPLPKPLED